MTSALKITETTKFQNQACHRFLVDGGPTGPSGPSLRGVRVAISKLKLAKARNSKIKLFVFFVFFETGARLGPLGPPLPGGVRGAGAKMHVNTLAGQSTPILTNKI